MVWDRTASIFMTRLYETGLHPFYGKIVWGRTASIFMTRWHETGLHPFLWQHGMRQDCIHFYDKMVWGRTASIFMGRLYEAGLHPVLWQDGMRQDCIHFYGKIVWGRTASIFMTRWHETGLHPFLWEDCMRQDCIHFYGKIVWDRTASIFMGKLYEAGLHPFLWQDGMRPVLYIGMYIHIYTHIYVHIYTSQKECLYILCDSLAAKYHEDGHAGYESTRSRGEHERHGSGRGSQFRVNPALNPMSDDGKRKVCHGALGPSEVPGPTESSKWQVGYVNGRVWMVHQNAWKTATADLSPTAPQHSIHDDWNWSYKIYCGLLCGWCSSGGSRWLAKLQQCVVGRTWSMAWLHLFPKEGRGDRGHCVMGSGRWKILH